MIPFARQVTRYSLINKRSRFFKSINISGSNQSNEHSSKVAHPLRNRGLIKVSGPEAVPFLQGLMTNDMDNFKKGTKSMYAMFLNTQGRVLYDTLVHKWENETEKNEFMIECDKGIQFLLQKHLQIYQLKREISIEDVSKLFKIWALIAPPNESTNLWISDITNNFHIYKDPRLTELGYRLITPPAVRRVDIHQAVGYDTFVKNDEEEYQDMRYKLGVSEGAEDLSPGTCFPLEVNCDYLNGVSFHKCYYIGKDLTARVHNTGVVSNRMMPILFIDIIQKEDLQKDATIWGNFDSRTTNLGKLKAYSGTHGLGLVKVKDALEAETINIGSNPVEIIKPHWWPVSREKILEKPGTSTN